MGGNRTCSLAEAQALYHFRKNRLKERKLRQEIGRRILLGCSSSRTRINLIASLSKN
jgi:hypothetical protein